MEIDTLLVRYDAAPGDPHRPTCTPLYQTATFSLDPSEDTPRHDYTRSGNPTRDVLESQMLRLEGGRHALAYTSGVAALSAVFGLARSGQSILAGSDLYGGTVRLLARIFPRRGVAVRFGDPGDAVAFARLADATTRIVHVETPTNPSLRIVDLAALAEALRDRFAGLDVAPPLLSVDNTLMTPYLQRPLDLGAAIVVHSATKGLSGHADVTAGVVVTSDEGLAEELAYLRNAEGTALAPFEALLLLRGPKTLAVRPIASNGPRSRSRRCSRRSPGSCGCTTPGWRTTRGRRSSLAKRAVPVRWSRSSSIRPTAHGRSRDRSSCSR
jgi:cystathionine beta-lyase